MAENREKALRDRVINRIEYIIEKGAVAGGEMWYAEIVSDLIDELLEDLKRDRV